MADPDTDTLRKMAPCWNLAGDETLLTILQNTHQRLVSKCQEANSQLEQMAAALDDASISLQNVNNQFMALSSSQFIERRVYDDDVEVAADPAPAEESPKVSPPDDLAIIKRSIAVIESTHEVYTILHDSDTESDTDDDLPDRLVMRPKDVYAERPLPYIIGSEPWKSKWHAGLMPEDSDTDSSASRVDRESDQYSQSEPEEFHLESSNVQDIPTPHHGRHLSETSSELPSELTPDAKPTPADVASELARRLGGGDIPPRVVEQEPGDEETPKPVARKVYKPQEPVASTIFPDEPPPFEEQSDSDTDVFADLQRKQPYNQPYSRRDITEDLFGRHTTEDEGGDIFSDFANQPASSKPVSLFEAGPTPHMFDKQHHAEEQPPAKVPPRNTDKSDRNGEPSATNTIDGRGVKKPVGGISLFGSNKGAENIGAAILERNRRKSNTSGEESGNETPSYTSPIKEQAPKKEKDIFDDLFAKSQTKMVTAKANNIVREIKQEIQNKKEEKAKKDVPKPIDLFSDNLFDDIDDIFSSNIVKTSNEKPKSIFEDDDDLFSDIADPKPVPQNSKNNEKKGLFDSDDDLFSENIPKEKPSISNKPQSTDKRSTYTSEVNEQSSQSNEIASVEKIAKNLDLPSITKTTASVFDEDEDDLFSNVKINSEKSKVQNKISTVNTINISRNVFNSPSLFDDDENEESDIFSDVSKSQQMIKEDLTSDEITTGYSSSKHPISETVSDEGIHAANTVSGGSASAIPIVEHNISTNNLLSVANCAVNDIPSESKPEITQNTSSYSIKDKNFKEEIKNDSNLVQSTLMKTDEFEEPNVNYNILADNNVETLKTPETKSSEHMPELIVSNGIVETAAEPKKNSVVTNKTNINTKTTQVRKHLEDDNDPISDTTCNKQVFGEESVHKFVETLETSETKNIDHMPELNVSNEIVETAAKPEKDSFVTNINIKTTQVQKLLDDDNDAISDTTCNKQVFVEKPVLVTNPYEISNNRTVEATGNDLCIEIPKINIHEKLSNAQNLMNDGPLEDNFTSPNNISNVEGSKIFNTDKPANANIEIANDIPDANIFSDILSEPPQFEKPKEPKKSKNVNALFDDDSDDESLFFKSDDVITDEKPEHFTVKHDRLFHMFTNEPPDEDITKIDEDLDDDFFNTLAKPKLPSGKNIALNANTSTAYDIDNEIFNVNDGLNPISEIRPKSSKAPSSNFEEHIDEIFVANMETNKTKPIEEITSIFDEDEQQQQQLFQQPKSAVGGSTSEMRLLDDDDDDALFKSLPVQLPMEHTELPSPNNVQLHEERLTSLPSQLRKKETFKEVNQPISNVTLTTEKTKSSNSNSRSEVKKVGKLKVGFNINVNALMPGASPKKVKATDNTDGQIISQVEVQKNIQLPKLVSFDGEPESKVLDNKLSKERPRIQVKRRPSSRKARKEAVRKSGIDFGDDSTDNSSSIDDQQKAQSEIVKATDNVNNNEVEQSGSNEDINTNVNEKYEDEKCESEDLNLNNETSIETAIKPNVNQIKTDIERQYVKSDSTTKIVYILNDEDIFNTRAVEDPITNSEIVSNLSEDNVTKNTEKCFDTDNLNSNITIEPFIETLGNTYQSTRKEDNKKSLFGEDERSDGEEIFKHQKPVSKSTIFDSDSEGELFISKKVETNKKGEKVLKTVKGSLFGDEDDDNDLFGVKPSKRTEPQHPSKSSATIKEPPKNTEPVFEDPLSMFGDED